MTNDTPRTTTTTTVMPKQSRILAELVWDHKHGYHRNSPNPGCAACLLSGALDQDGGEG